MICPTSDDNKYQEELIKEREALDLAHKTRYVPGHYGKPPTPAEVLHGEPDATKTNEKLKQLGKAHMNQSSSDKSCLPGWPHQSQS